MPQDPIFTPTPPVDESGTSPRGKRKRKPRESDPIVEMARTALEANLLSRRRLIELVNADQREALDRRKDKKDFEPILKAVAEQVQSPEDAARYAELLREKQALTRVDSLEERELRRLARVLTLPGKPSEGRAAARAIPEALAQKTLTVDQLAAALDEFAPRSDEGSPVPAPIERPAEDSVEKSRASAGDTAGSPAGSTDVDDSLAKSEVSTSEPFASRERPPGREEDGKPEPPPAVKGRSHRQASLTGVSSSEPPSDIERVTTEQKGAADAVGEQKLASATTDLSFEANLTVFATRLDETKKTLRTAEKLRTEGTIVAQARSLQELRGNIETLQDSLKEILDQTNAAIAEMRDRERKLPHHLSRTLQELGRSRSRVISVSFPRITVGPHHAFTVEVNLGRGTASVAYADITILGAFRRLEAAPILDFIEETERRFRTQHGKPEVFASELYTIWREISAGRKQAKVPVAEVWQQYAKAHRLLTDPKNGDERRYARALFAHALYESKEAKLGNGAKLRLHGAPAVVIQSKSVDDETIPLPGPGGKQYIQMIEFLEPASPAAAPSADGAGEKHLSGGATNE